MSDFGLRRRLGRLRPEVEEDVMESLLESGELGAVGEAVGEAGLVAGAEGLALGGASLALPALVAGYGVYKGAQYVSHALKGHEGDYIKNPHVLKGVKKSTVEDRTPASVPFIPGGDPPPEPPTEPQEPGGQRGQDAPPSVDRRGNGFSGEEEVPNPVDWDENKIETPAPRQPESVPGGQKVMKQDNKSGVIRQPITVRQQAGSKIRRGRYRYPGKGVISYNNLRYAQLSNAYSKQEAGKFNASF